VTAVLSDARQQVFGLFAEAELAINCEERHVMKHLAKKISKQAEGVAARCEKLGINWQRDM
jgi:hypothetical protein